MFFAISCSAWRWSLDTWSCVVCLGCFMGVVVICSWLVYVCGIRVWCHGIFEIGYVGLFFEWFWCCSRGKFLPRLPKLVRLMWRCKFWVSGVHELFICMRRRIAAHKEWVKRAWIWKHAPWGLIGTFVTCNWQVLLGFWWTRNIVACTRYVVWGGSGMIRW